MKIEGKSEPVTLYVANYVGREDWLVLTANFDTLMNVLRIYNTDYTLPLLDLQKNIYERHVHLVPRKRLNLRDKHFGYLSEQTIRPVMEDRVEDEPRLNFHTIYNYIDMFLPDSNISLVAGFRYTTRQHLAHAFHLFRKSPFLSVKREEREVREFLVDIRPILKRVDKLLLNPFLKRYVRLNPVSWNDALKLVCGDLTLREKVFQRLCRSQLLLSDIQQHCSPHLYHAIRYIREFEFREDSGYHDIGKH